MLANYGYIGLFLAFAIFFAVATLLLPYALSFPSRLRRLPSPVNIIPSLIRLFMPSSIIRFIERKAVQVSRYDRLVPWNPNPIKDTTYECGMETIGEAWVQFNFRYYFYALLFITLDVLIVFLYPWAVELRQLGFFAFIAVLVLVLIVLVGYVYAWRKKVLEWK